MLGILNATSDSNELVEIVQTAMLRQIIAIESY